MLINTSLRIKNGSNALTIELPMEDDAFEATIAPLRFCVVTDSGVEEEQSAFDVIASGGQLVAQGSPDISKWEVVHVESNVFEMWDFDLSNPKRYTIEQANKIMQQLEEFDAYEQAEFLACREDDATIEEAIDEVSSGSPIFYEDQTLAEVAEELVREGVFNPRELLDYINYDKLGEALSTDYTETSFGVICRN